MTTIDELKVIEGKTVKKVERKYCGDRAELTFEDGSTAYFECGGTSAFLRYGVDNSTLKK